MTTQPKANILLVDDKPARLMTYETILEPLKQNLVKATSGLAALQCLMQHDFAAILLDVNMPEMDGFETARMIHRHPRFEKIPIIFVTGVNLDDMDRLRGYRLGAVDYVHVPVIPEILRGKVHVLVQLYLQRRELQKLNENLAAANAELAETHREAQAQSTRELQRLNQALELKNAELNEAAQRKDEFLAILAHELRNPLSAIRNGVQLMYTRDETDSRWLWVRGLLDRQTTHLTRLIDDLLDVSRITTGRVQLKLETVDIANVITKAVEATRPLMEKKRHQLTLKIADEAIWVNADPVRLVQMVDNLLTNAAKYTDEGGSIELTLEADSATDRVIIRVRDNGIGIPETMIERVFGLFVQVDRSDGRAQGGLGIGLSLVRGLVEMHGGDINVVSSGYGCGSEFTIRLPRVPAPTPTTATRAETAGQQAPRVDGLRVLIIDDNQDSAMGLALCLEDHCKQVRLAHSGQAGIIAANEFTPDIILLDIGLPDIDGYEVARRLRADVRTQQIPIVAMTGFGADANRQQASTVGFNDYLVKPVDSTVVIGLIAEQTKALHQRLQMERGLLMTQLPTDTTLLPSGLEILPKTPDNLHSV